MASRKMAILSTALAVVATVATAPSANAIVGGGLKSDGPAYMARISLYDRNFNDKGVCTGSLIDDEWVLTARHCIDDLKFDAAGGDSFWIDFPQARYNGLRVDRVTSEYRSNDDTDVALIHVDRISEITPAELVDTDDKVCQHKGDVVEVLGYGGSGRSWNDTEVLRSATYKVEDRIWSRAQDRLHYNYLMKINEMGYGEVERGDSGGPVLCTNGAAIRNRVVAITSATDGKSSAAVVRLASIRRWIDEQVS